MFVPVGWLVVPLLLLCSFLSSLCLGCIDAFWRCGLFFLFVSVGWAVGAMGEVRSVCLMY